MLLKSKYHEYLNYLGKQMLRPKKRTFSLDFRNKRTRNLFPVIFLHDQTFVTKTGNK